LAKPLVESRQYVGFWVIFGGFNGKFAKKAKKGLPGDPPGKCIFGKRMASGTGFLERQWEGGVKGQFWGVFDPFCKFAAKTPKIPLKTHFFLTFLSFYIKTPQISKGNPKILRGECVFRKTAFFLNYSQMCSGLCRGCIASCKKIQKHSKNQNPEIRKSDFLKNLRYLASDEFCLGSSRGNKNEDKNNPPSWRVLTPFGGVYVHIISS